MVLVPLKSFELAKSRLGACCSPAERSELTRWMATRVLAATAPLQCVVVCENAAVAEFARDNGADVHWAPGVDLNGALASAIAAVADTGVHRVTIAAGDLPFAHDLGNLDALMDSPLQPREVLLIGDRHDDGTNVMSFATSDPLTPSYGPGSLRRHTDQVRHRGLPLRQLQDDRLCWDIDTPDDLRTPAHLGTLEALGAPSTAGALRR